jgi:UDP:flavonoid glycosyltransferase YjiC (YdhE family)
LEDFIEGSGEAGFIYASMGTSVRDANMDNELFEIFNKTFAQLPYRVLWKFDSSLEHTSLPSNVKTVQWLPQQDVLGHPKLRAFVTHGGLLSMYETVYHGVPAVIMPVFVDHDVNSEKAKTDGYGETTDFLPTEFRLLISFFTSSEAFLGNSHAKKAGRRDSCCDSRQKISPSS